MAVISSRAATVSSRLAACCSVRFDKSVAPSVIAAMPRVDGRGIGRHDRHRLAQLNNRVVEIIAQLGVLAGQILSDPMRQIAFLEKRDRGAMELTTVVRS